MPTSLLINNETTFDPERVAETFNACRPYQFLNCNCIYELQFIFRSGHSTNHALLSLTGAIRNDSDENSFVVGVFVDLQKLLVCRQWIPFK